MTARADQDHPTATPGPRASTSGARPPRLHRDDGGKPWYDGLACTEEELSTLPDDGYQYEMDDGVLRVHRYGVGRALDEEDGVSPAPVDRHQQVVLEIALLLAPFVKARKLGLVWVAPRDVRLAPRKRRQPDLLFLSRERLALNKPEYIDGAPDLVIEVLSADSLGRDLRTKFSEYERYGVREYWVMNPEALGSSEVFALVDGRFVAIGPVDGRIASRVLEGFVLDLADLERSLDPFGPDSADR